VSDPVAGVLLRKAVQPVARRDLGAVVPVIFYFLGIYVGMYFDDRLPPPIHGEYQGDEAFVAIESGEVLSGKLPKKVASLVRDWRLQHLCELIENWNRAVALQPVEKITGADNDYPVRTSHHGISRQAHLFRPQCG
jgi:hypothetical protein